MVETISDQMRRKLRSMANTHNGRPSHGRAPPPRRHRDADAPQRRDHGGALPDGIVDDARAGSGGCADEVVRGDEEEMKKRQKRHRDAVAGAGGAGEEGASGGVIPGITYDDMGGLEKERPLIKELVELPIKAPHLFQRLGADPPLGILLHGPPGCGKTKLVHAIAGSLKVPLFFVSGPEIVSGISGDSEKKLRTLFMDAIAASPSIILLDELDTIAGHREGASRGMESRIVGQLLACMDQAAAAWRAEGKVVCIMGATNRPEALDSALRRAGRFDRELPLGIPSLDERVSILRVLTRQLQLESDVNFFELATMTPGYVGADLHLLIKEACVVAIRRKHRELEGADELENPNSECLSDFMVRFSELKEATKRVKPSAMREGFTTIPNVTWEDIGALEDVRQELITCILQPIRAPKLHRRFGLDHPIGILLYGPPGCGKTLVAKAIANESGANFISIKGPELLNKFVGESERSVRMVFARGRASAPCVLFFDELDALAPRRGSDRANPSSERVVNQLLTEMDGVEGRESVFVIGATNRPDIIDPAMLRPGRLDKLMYVPLPDARQRASILKTVGRKYPLSPEVNLEQLALNAHLNGFSGADLASLVREASLSALRSIYQSKTQDEVDEIEKNADIIKEELMSPSNLNLPSICPFDFDIALGKVKPSVNTNDMIQYEKLHKELSAESKGGG